MLCKNLKKIVLVVCVMCLSGCLSGSLNYTKPIQSAKMQSNSIIVDKSKDAVWKELIPALGKQFWVINNIDKDSGLLNMSYNGDPEKYIDCGRISSYVSNARGERTYNFPAAKAYQNYEIVDKGNLYFADRKMSLEGRINLIVQELSPVKTQVTANTKYVVTKVVNVRHVAGGSTSFNDIISFNSGQGAVFPGQINTECYATGELEASILGILKPTETP